jgi:hypothetical protein
MDPVEAATDTNMSTNFLSKLKEKTNKAISNTTELVLIETMKIDEETRNTRLDLCLSCEHLFTPTQNCKKCGCFVQAKTWLKDASCPIKKW